MFKGMNVTPEDDFMDSRKILLMNNDLKMGLAKPRKSMDYFYKMLNVMNFYMFIRGTGF
jgi:homogentisate 1,2-dioxygenase